MKPIKMLVIFTLVIIVLTVFWNEVGLFLERSFGLPIIVFQIILTFISILEIYYLLMKK